MPVFHKRYANTVYRFLIIHITTVKSAVRLQGQILPCSVYSCIMLYIMKYYADISINKGEFTINNCRSDLSLELYYVVDLLQQRKDVGYCRLHDKGVYVIVGELTGQSYVMSKCHFSARFCPLMPAGIMSEKPG